MNVFYKGVANPIDVSVPGFSPEDLQVSGQGVSIKKIKPVSMKPQSLKMLRKMRKLLLRQMGKQ